MNINKNKKLTQKYSLLILDTDNLLRLHCTIKSPIKSSCVRRALKDSAHRFIEEKKSSSVLLLT
jgi:hypothetical protein